MKKIISLIAFIIAFCGVISAQKYSIFKVEGNVLLKSKNSEEWRPAVKHMQITESDLLKVSSGASLSIVESSTNRIISSVKAGEYTVYDFTKAAAKK